MSQPQKTSEQKPSEMDAAIAAGKSRRAQAVQKHPAQTGAPEPFPTDEDDKPVYSAKQVERLLQTEREAMGGGAATPAAPATGVGLQKASLDDLKNEMQRRHDLAKGKLKDIPTDWLEIELARRKADGET